MKNWLERIWWRPEPPPWALRPFAGLYSAVADRLAAKKRVLALSLPVPVLVVGNIAVGGTGKTPITLWLVELLRGMGHTPGVISRGYGGAGPFPLLVGAATSPASAGDEPVLIALRSGAPLCVAPDRVAAAGTLLAAYPQVDLLICDDGLQHYRLARAFELCVVDGARGHGNGWRLPAGPLREPLQRLESCDWVLVNGGAAESYGVRALRFDLRALEARNLATGETRPLSSFAAAGTVHAVAGIGNPARFFNTLRSAGLAISERAFADHHAYTAEDLRFGDTAAVLMTEKDAVKCAAFADARLWAVPVTVVFSAADTERVRKSLATVLKDPA